MKNQEQKFSINQEEPILNYLMKKLLRQNPQNRGKDINQEIKQLENVAENFANQNEKNLEYRIENMLLDYEPEEITQMLVEFFEDLTDEPLTESQQIAKSNQFLEKFGLQIAKRSDGKTEISLA